jgi:GntR family transcriptional regulator
MQISINENSPVPLFSQIIAQIREAVRRGALKAGTPLPAIRQLASDLQINPNTVAKAYRLLERDNVIETRGRYGSFVHRDGKKYSVMDRGLQATTALEEVIASLRGTGLTDSEIRIAFANVLKVQG